MRRFQHNPRVLDVARSIPRGTIFDRRGLPLATGDAADVRQARAGYRRFDVDVDPHCGDSLSRCYPLGAATFHLLGNADSRVNWTAPNTSYVERDADTRLRVRSPVPGRIVIFKDGVVLVDETGIADKEVAVTERGVYRAEVYLPQLGNLPWIISNPVYVR